MRRIIGRSVKETEIKITAEGQRHLGAVIGDLKFKQGYIDGMVSDWVKEWNILADVAKFHAQSAYCAFTASYRHKLETLDFHIEYVI